MSLRYKFRDLQRDDREFYGVGCLQRNAREKRWIINEKNITCKCVKLEM